MHVLAFNASSVQLGTRLDTWYIRILLSLADFHILHQVMFHVCRLTLVTRVNLTQSHRHAVDHLNCLTESFWFVCKVWHIKYATVGIEICSFYSYFTLDLIFLSSRVHRIPRGFLYTSFEHVQTQTLLP
jgi:hypothetical protein